MKCNFLTKNEKNKLIDIEKKLNKLHSKLQKYFIGWDIILDCDKAYVLEGNVCPGSHKIGFKSIDKFKKIFYKNY